MKKRLLILCILLMLPLAAKTKVLSFAGSTRVESYNKKLAKQAADIATEMGAEVTFIDLKEYPMPLYDADLEKNEGMPLSAKKLRDLMMASDAVIIASPQYNASVSAALKNAIDWTSRSEEGGASDAAFSGKKFVIISASPGKKGGAKGLVHLRTILEDCGASVMKKQVSIPHAAVVFDENGQIKDAALSAKLFEVVEQLK